MPGGKNQEIYALGGYPRLQNGQKSQLVEQIRRKMPTSPGAATKCERNEWGRGRENPKQNLRSGS